MREIICVFLTNISDGLSSLQDVGLSRHVERLNFLNFLLRSKRSEKITGEILKRRKEGYGFDI